MHINNHNNNTRSPGLRRHIANERRFKVQARASEVTHDCTKRTNNPEPRLCGTVEGGMCHLRRTA